MAKSIWRGGERMKITNIDLTNPNWREQVDKHIQETEHIKMIEETRNISTMSGGLELRLYTILPKVYRKIINKLSKYKKNSFE